jgi:glycosyltransferase involved in cell wall biosynthesis
MRVGLVIYGSLETQTGGYLYDRRLVEHLSGRGDDVEVVSLPWRNHARHLCDNASRALARRLDSGRFDVLVQDELNHPSLVLTNRRLHRASCPIVAVVHGLRAHEHGGSPLRRVYAAIERRYLADVDAAVFCSQATRTAAELLVGAPLAGVVAHPGCDHLPPAAPRGRRDGPLRVVHVANVLANKGLLVLLAALARLPPDAWRLTVAGSLTSDRPHVRRVRDRLAHGGLARNVELVGEVENRELPALLAAADVLAVPSTYEALGIAYLEAMRCGLPVIATTAGGAREIVDHGSEGFLVAPGDVAALARHLAALQGDRELLARMGAAAQRRAARHPSWDASLGGASDLLRRVVHDRRGLAGEVAA